MAAKRDYYDILGVLKSASADELKSAYRKQALTWHPDRNRSSEAEQKFKELNEAYEVLSDSQKKAAYDQFGHAAFTPGGGPPPGGAAGFGGFPGGGAARTGRYGPFTYTYTTRGDQGSPFGGFDFTDPFEIFEQFFGGASPGRRQHKPHYHLEISFMEAVRGVEKEVVIEGKKKKIRVPAGADDGTHIVFADFDITIGVSNHPTFRREGADVFVEVAIPLTLAILGGEIEVPTIDGDLKLRIRPGTQLGIRVRLRERGVQHLRGRGRGDQYVRINVLLPEKLTKHQQKLVRELKEEGL